MHRLCTLVVPGTAEIFREALALFTQQEAFPLPSARDLLAHCQESRPVPKQLGIFAERQALTLQQEQGMKAGFSRGDQSVMATISDGRPVIMIRGYTDSEFLVDILQYEGLRGGIYFFAFDDDTPASMTLGEILTAVRKGELPTANAATTAAA